MRQYVGDSQYPPPPSGRAERPQNIPGATAGRQHHSRQEIMRGWNPMQKILFDICRILILLFAGFIYAIRGVIYGGMAGILISLHYLIYVWLAGGDPWATAQVFKASLIISAISGYLYPFVVYWKLDFPGSLLSSITIKVLRAKIFS